MQTQGVDLREADAIGGFSLRLSDTIRASGLSPVLSRPAYVALGRPENPLELNAAILASPWRHPPVDRALLSPLLYSPESEGSRLSRRPNAEIKGVRYELRDMKTAEMATRRQSWVPQELPDFAFPSTLAA